MTATLEVLTNAFGAVQQALFEAVVQPTLFSLGFANFLDDGFDATGWLLVGLLQLAVLATVIGPLQRWRPVEAVTDRATVRVDMLYTAIHRLGLFRVVLFFTVAPWFDALFGTLRVAGWETFHLDAVWPGVTDQPVASLLIYLLAIDFCNYWMHRGQHRFEWWWSLHSLHHSQRQMTMWSDNRNHLLDDLIRDSLMVFVAQLIGIAPGQFVAIVALTQLSENFQHANLRVWFGRVGERLWVSPRFHRLHHSVGIGHESAGRQTLGGANFGVLLPWWDMLFGTANFEKRFDPTGVRDQVEQGRDYGHGFWNQQWLGLKRLAGRA
jgi:sterol desaturase/sphingolipid hydroxylase (fatty acid hydroxylase superfamily)